MSYHFEMEDAVKYGVNEAIFLSHLRFWIQQNRANNRNFHEGRYWTYNTIEALKIIFPFWTTDKIRYILRKLIAQKVIAKGHFSKNKFDKTNWLTILKDLSVIEYDVPCAAANLPDRQPCGLQGESYLEHQQNNMREIYRTEQADLPLLNTDINITDKIIRKNYNKKICSKNEQFEEWYKMYPRRQAKAKAKNAWAKLDERKIELAFEGLKDYLREIELLQKYGIFEEQYVPLPASWLNGERWNDDRNGESTIARMANDRKPYRERKNEKQLQDEEMQRAYAADREIMRLEQEQAKCLR